VPGVQRFQSAGTRTPARCHPDKLADSWGLCHNCYGRQKFKHDPVARKRAYASKYRHRKARAYGLTLDQYDALIVAHGGVCAICGKEPDELVIDHDHNSGAVRGMLCHQCNLGLGMLEQHLKKALEYVGTTSVLVPPSVG
jgi:hypothetical protein